MNNMDFEFIKGYENLYKINRNGDIYSCHYKKNMTYLEKSDGYYYVDLRIDGKRHKCYIHRLLALQYIENTDNKPEVDHIDRNNKNNALENLRWVTRIENRNNRADIIEQLTEEQKEERLKKIRDYKAKWARENKLKKKIENNERPSADSAELKPIIEKQTVILTEEEKKLKMREYKSKWARENRLKKKETPLFNY